MFSSRILTRVVNLKFLWRSHLHYQMKVLATLAFLTGAILPVVPQAHGMLPICPRYGPGRFRGQRCLQNIFYVDRLQCIREMCSTIDDEPFNYINPTSRLSIMVDGTQYPYQGPPLVSEDLLDLITFFGYSMRRVRPPLTECEDITDRSQLKIDPTTTNTVQAGSVKELLDALGTGAEVLMNDDGDVIGVAGPAQDRSYRLGNPEDSDICCTTEDSYLLNDTLIDIRGIPRTIAQMEHIGTHQFIRHGFCGCCQGTCQGQCTERYVTVQLVIWPPDDGQLVSFRFFEVPSYCHCVVNGSEQIYRK